MITLPGLIDIQTHIGAAKSEALEDWSSLTAAALAGGFTTVLAMPDAAPMVADGATLTETCQSAAETAVCDFGQLVAATAGNARNTADFQAHAAAILLHSPGLEEDSVLKNMHAMNRVFSTWTRKKPICVDADAQEIGTALFTAKVHNKPIHIFNVSTAEQIEMIRESKLLGTKVSCSVTPHHLFLSQKHIQTLPEEVKASFPPLGTEEDRRILWKNLDLIDCFASNHRPYRPLDGSEEQLPVSGYPGLETALPLYLHAVQGGFLTLKDLIARCVTNPRRIFHLPEQKNTHIEIDDETVHKIEPATFFSKSKWSPYAHMAFSARVIRVTLRGQIVYEDGKLLAEPGSGKNVAG